MDGRQTVELGERRDHLISSVRVRMMLPPLLSPARCTVISMCISVSSLCPVLLVFTGFRKVAFRALVPYRLPPQRSSATRFAAIWDPPVAAVRTFHQTGDSDFQKLDPDGRFRTARYLKKNPVGYLLVVLFAVQQATGTACGALVRLLLRSCLICLLGGLAPTRTESSLNLQGACQNSHRLTSIVRDVHNT